MTPGRRQAIVLGVIVLIVLGIGTVLEGGPTPEVAAALAKAANFFARAPSQQRITPSQIIAHTTSDIARFSHPIVADALAEAYLQRAFAYLEKREPAMSEKDLNEVLHFASEPSTRMNALEVRVAIRADCDHAYAAALADLDTIAQIAHAHDISRGPGDDLINRAAIYGDMGQYGIAIRDLTIAISAFDKWNSSQANLLGISAADHAKIQRAQSRAMAVLYERRGGWEVRAGDGGAALRDYNRAIEIAPDSSAAYNLRAGFSMRQGHVGAALADYWRGWRTGSPAQHARSFCHR